MTTLVTFATPSHLDMCRRFVPERSKLAGFDDVIFIECPEQLCPSGRYDDVGFNDVMLQKVGSLMKLPADGKQYLYVDADCVLFSGLREWCDANGSDAVQCGDDGGQLCMGTMLFRQTTQVQWLWSIVRDFAWMLERHDQCALNTMKGNMNRMPVETSTLTSDRFANWNSCRKYDGVDLWNGQEIELPKSVVCFHANYCLGVEAKIELLGKASTKDDLCRGWCKDMAVYPNDLACPQT